jgi:hypothetical protein
MKHKRKRILNREINAMIDEHLRTHSRVFDKDDMRVAMPRLRQRIPDLTFKEVDRFMIEEWTGADDLE